MATPPANRILSSEEDFTEGLEQNEESYLDVKHRQKLKQLVIENRPKEAMNLLDRRWPSFAQKQRPSVKSSL
jgi:hypothetical protein